MDDTGFFQSRAVGFFTDLDDDIGPDGDRKEHHHVPDEVFDATEREGVETKGGEENNSEVDIVKAFVGDENIMQPDDGVVDAGSEMVVKPFCEGGEDLEEKEIGDHVSCDRSDEDKPDGDTWIARQKERYGSAKLRHRDHRTQGDGEEKTEGHADKKRVMSAFMIVPNRNLSKHLRVAMLGSPFMVSYEISLYE